MPVPRNTVSGEDLLNLIEQLIRDEAGMIPAIFDALKFDLADVVRVSQEGVYNRAADLSRRVTSLKVV
jgi:hypothetical protein